MPAFTEFRLKADVLMPLSVKSDAAAAWHAIGHGGAIVLSAAALWALLDTLWAVPLTLLHGTLVAFLFTALHETAHQTAFRTRAGNFLVGHLSAFVILLPYEYYRAFHWDHHRYTQDPARDPELSFALPASRLG
ncbi:MAG: fatty acid desaturase, partial [Rhizobacter sp.]|nr:fatty acid desaturase [Rhizobacter sp.]